MRWKLIFEQIRLGIHMKKYFTLLMLALLFTVGCADENVIQHEKPESIETEETSDKENETEEEEPTKEEKPEKKKQTKLDTLNVHYIDAGQGDAALLEFTDRDDSYAILYDAGDWQGNEVVPYLQNEGIDYLDIIIISHPHADHIGQLEDVLANIEVGEVWMTGNTANSTVYERATEAILASDADYDEPEAGDVFDVGAMTLSILHPKSLTGGLNEDSLSVHFAYGDVAFLFTGDAYTEQEEQMIASGKNVEADFLQLGHHGSKTSTGQAFIDAVNPEYAIYSAGKGNSYGHPHQEVLDRLDAKNITTYGTDVHGNIIVTTDGIESTIKTNQDGKVLAGTGGKKNTSSTKKSPKPKEEKASTGNCVDINTASASELQQIIHIGEARAADVIDLRPFDKVEDLDQVNGIGPARLDDILAENKACVGGD